MKFFPTAQFVQHSASSLLPLTLPSPTSTYTLNTRPIPVYCVPRRRAPAAGLRGATSSPAAVLNINLPFLKNIHETVRTKVESPRWRVVCKWQWDNAISNADWQCVFTSFSSRGRTTWRHVTWRSASRKVYYRPRSKGVGLHTAGEVWYLRLPSYNYYSSKQ